MATPQRQLSRSRPMKATEPFGSGTVNTGKQSGYWTQGSPLCGVPLSKKTEFRERRTSPITQATGLPSPIGWSLIIVGQIRTWANWIIPYSDVMNCYSILM